MTRGAGLPNPATSTQGAPGIQGTPGNFAPRNNLGSGIPNNTERIGFSSDLPAKLFDDWNIRVIARIIGSYKQIVVVRFTPLKRDLAEAGSIEVILTYENGKANTVDLTLGADTVLAMELQDVDPTKDLVEISLKGHSIRGTPFDNDKMIVPIQERRSL